MDFGDESLPQRFWAKVHPEPNTGCWLWSGTVNKNGYGRFVLTGRSGDKNYAAHRLVLNHQEGLEVDHLCRVRWCVNPDHLEWVTRTENMRRSAIHRTGSRSKSTHCPHGHEWTPENTYIGSKTTRTGLRSEYKACRTCHRDKESARKARIKAKEIK